MDGEEPEDTDIRRLWFIANAAKEFGVLPSVVADDMERDPRRLTLTIMPLLAYGRCKGEFDAFKGDEKQMEGWKGTATYEAVMQNTFDLKVERLNHRKHEQHDESCRLCRVKGTENGR